MSKIIGGVILKIAMCLLICLVLTVPIAFAEINNGYYDVLIAESTWNAIDKTSAGYSTINEFYDYVLTTMQNIADFVNRPDWYVIYGENVVIEYRMTEGPSHAEGGYRAVNNPIPITYLNQPLFEQGMAPIAHETTHIMYPKFSLLSLREGLASYCHERFGGNPTVFSFEVPVHEHVRYLYDTQFATFKETLDVMGDLLGELPYAEGETREIYYTISHSLAKYIIEKYGISPYMRLYESDPYNVSFENELGISYDALKQEWIDYIKSLPLGMSNEEIATALSQY